jgi:hypothetical protein
MPRTALSRIVNMAIFAAILILTMLVVVGL